MVINQLTFNEFKHHTHNTNTFEHTIEKELTDWNGQLNYFDLDLIILYNFIINH